ncbi:hypothetical protein ONO23_06067 [Micromonospora noduli]|nr:hypothetical protein ONO23_06067 [Micromonospora noduli]RAO58133.1 hypothetical protein ONO86_00272 [Micromonospora noduli]
MSDQAREPIIQPMTQEPSSTIERVEICVNDVWRVTQIMKPCGGDKHIRVKVQRTAEPLSLSCDGLHMPPPSRQGLREVLLGKLSRPSAGSQHGRERRAGVTRAPAF